MFLYVFSGNSWDEMLPKDDEENSTASRAATKADAKSTSEPLASNLLLSVLKSHSSLALVLVSPFFL